MAYTRKTKDVYILLSNYGYGWDEELTEDTYQEAKEQLKTYRENCPGAQYKIVKKRVKIENEIICTKKIPCSCCANYETCWWTKK